jgi:hypothetical protein
MHCGQAAVGSGSTASNSDEVEGSQKARGEGQLIANASELQTAKEIRMYTAVPLWAEFSASIILLRDAAGVGRRLTRIRNSRIHSTYYIRRRNVTDHVVV